jgi:hypothetical protein
MFPLVFLLMCCIGYTILGLIVLACLPALRLTFLNLFLFLVGAFPGGLALLFVYGRIFARNQLSDAAFYGIFPILLVGGASGGALLVWLKTRLVKT